MARVNTGNRNGHEHKYTDNASKKAGAPYTTYSEGHQHKVIRDDAGRVLRIGAAGSPSHTHPIR